MVQLPKIALIYKYHQACLYVALTCGLAMTNAPAPAATPPDEGLYHQLEAVKAPKTVTPPFPFEQKDRLQDANGRVSQSAQKAYASFWKRLMPLLNHLASVETAMSEGRAKQKTLTLQWFASQVVWARLLQQQSAGTFKPEDAQYKTYQLVQQAVANLEDALAFWQGNEAIGASYRPTAVNVDEEAVYLDAKLRVALESLVELKQLTDLYWLLEKGYKQGDR
ncbi:MAG: hypothetical protein H2174_08340 [Vampirovibrio sp.]|nr:hypothetical protein [Vampirovibrio sp.]